MSRTYDINDQQYPSVTTILDILDKPALKQWAVNSACDYIKREAGWEIIESSEDLIDVIEMARTEWKNISNDAMNIGSEIHDLIEKYIKDGRDAVGELKPEVENGFLAFLEWEQENIEEWTESERTVFDPIACYAGTLDACAKLKNGKYYVIDFKSSKGFYSGYDMQIAAYRYAYEQEMKIRMDGMGVLRLDKETGLPEFKDYSKVYEKKLTAWKKLLDYWYAAANRRCKNIRTRK
jgi:hypothetical protein